MRNGQRVISRTLAGLLGADAGPIQVPQSVQIKVGQSNGKVVVTFDRSVSYVDFTPADAVRLASGIKAQAIAAGYSDVGSLLDDGPTLDALAKKRVEDKGGPALEAEVKSVVRLGEDPSGPTIEAAP